MNIQSYIDDLRRRLRECPASRDQIALATDGAVSPSWVNKFAAGRMNNPRVDSLMALDQALSEITTPREAA
jgi:predicted transcriptional regulator